MGWGRSVGAVVVAIVVAGGVAAGVHHGSNGVPQGHAKWFVAVAGNDSTGNGSAGNPYATIDKAVSVAACSDVVELAAGTYPAQTVNDHAGTDGCNDSSRVTIQPAQGVTANLQNLTIGSGVSFPSYLTFANLTIPSGYGGFLTGAHHVTIQNLTAPTLDLVGTNSGAGVDTNTTSVTVLGGTIGGCSANSLAFPGVCVMRMEGTDVTVDGVTFTNITSTNDALYHTEDIFVRACVTCVIRNNVFLDNAPGSATVLVQNCCSLPVNNGLTVENNWFGGAYSPADGTLKATLEVDTSTASLIVRHNSTWHFCATGTDTKCSSNLTLCTGDGTADELKTGTACGTSISSAEVYGNLMGNRACAADTTYNYNLVIPFSPFTGQTLCSVTDAKIVSTAEPYTTDPIVPACGPGLTVPFSCQAAINYVITGGAWTGDGFVTNASYCLPATDHAGNARPSGNCDAGASER